MFVRLTALSVITAGTVFFAGAVAAQDIRSEVEAYPQTITINSPSSGTSVGRSVTFSGSAKPDTSLGVLIDGKQYLDVRDRQSSDEGRDYYSFKSDGTGQYSFSLDLNGSSVVMDPGGTRQALPAGTHTFMVHEMYAPTGGRSPLLQLSVTDGPSGATTRGSGQTNRPAVASGTSATASVSPLATPSAVVSALPAAEVKGFSISPPIVLGLLTLLGVLLVTFIHRISPVIRPKK